MSNQFNITYLSLLFLLVTLSFVFAPSIALFLLVVILLSNFDGEKNALIGLNCILAMLVVIAVSFNVSAKSLFDFYEDDFIAYFNNYYCFNEISSGCFLEFGNLEFNLTVVNMVLNFLGIGNHPRIVLFLHAALQVGLLLIIVSKFRDKYNLSISEFSLALAVFIVMYKWGALTLHLRQGYASIFICIALLTSTRSRYIYFIIAFLFHNSTILVYPLCKFLLFTTNRNRLLASAMFISAFPVLSLIFIYLSDHIYAVPFLANKLGYTLGNLNSDKVLMSSFFNAVNRVIYIIPLLILSMYSLYVKKNESARYFYTVCISLISFFMLSSTVPVLQRLLSPVTYVFLGGIYFLFFKAFYSLSSLRVFLFIMICITQVRWYYDYTYFYSGVERYNITPFYYLGDYLFESEEINRNLLDYRMSL
jgi:hypothetical protein